jgi:glycosyltransferase involved in cell wall biosynthesis
MNDVDGILQFCTSSSWGGLEMHIPILSGLLLKRGYRVTAMCREASPLEEQLDRDGIDHLSLGGGEYISPGAVLSIRKFLRDGKFGFIHSHYSRDLWKVVPPIKWSHSHCLIHTRHINSGIQKGDPLHRWLFNRVDGWVATSQEGRANLLETHPVNPAKVHVINFGVNISKNNRDLLSRCQVREEFGIDNEVIVVGMLGRMTPKKGHEIFFKAITSIQKQVDSNVIYLVVGGPSVGEEEYGNFLKKRVIEMGLQDRIVFTGQRNDVQRLFSAMDIYVMPSDKESFGISLLEAMCSGLPVVATSVGGPREVVEEGISGLLVPPRDPVRLAEAIVRLVRNGDLRRSLGRRARQRIEEHFSEETMVDGLLGVYNAVRYKMEM